MKQTNEEVRNFWDQNLCGSHFVSEEYLSKDFFQKYTAFRYKKAHHLLTLIENEKVDGKRFLEIGLGIGADATKWAQRGADYYGIDLTKEAVRATKQHFDYLGLKGNIQIADAESLNFSDNQFEVVYSHGVLHHTTDIQKAFKEIYRVLEHKGRFIVMLYAKESFNYWFRIQFYFRLRLVVGILLDKLGLAQNNLWNSHISNFKKMGWKYLSWHEFPHHCTDGPDCSIANIYSKKEIYTFLINSGFKIIRTKKAHFPLGGLFPGLEKLLGSFFGFHRFVWSIKE